MEGCWSNELILLLMLVLMNKVCAQAGSTFEEFVVQEELPMGTIICNLITEAGLDQDYNKDTLDKLRFQFLTRPHLDKEYFTINEQTGIIRTSNILDRDTLCPQKEECVIKFDIAVQPTEYFKIIKIQVIVYDINDNTPTFPQRTLSLDISESAVPGTSFVIPAARDPDGGRNGIQEYELLPPNGKFSLQHRKTADGATDLRLVLKERLDRETIDHDKVYIMAYDGGEPSKTGSIAVDITVLDANDNDPQFHNSTYETTVRENLPTGTTILRVRASDADAGNNGRIVYQFAKHTQQEYGNVFGIDDETGEIYVKGTLDYETDDIYLLSLIAHDKGPDSLPSHATAIVKVQDVNDNAPAIVVNTLTTNGVAQVMENSKLHTFVAHISVIDLDSDKNGKFTCSIVDEHFLLQKLYLTEFKIVTAVVFDRESQDHYTVSLVCKDKGNNPQISLVDIKVVIQDANDHVPQFLEGAYHVTLKENNEIGRLIVQVNATDKDSGPNGQILYRMDQRARDIVKIDPDTGTITAQIIFDYEETHSMEFDIIAEDRGDPIQSSRVPLKIAVIDLDDERPTFTQKSYSFGVYENQGPDAQVGQIEAIDRDAEPFNQFRYHLDPNSVSSDLFRIDPSRGTIVTTKPLDREAQPVHYVIAVVTPLDDPTYSSSASITIFVADQNDNPPVFDFPSPFNYTVEVSGKAPLNHVVTRLRAHDNDKSTNARLTFAITEGNEDNTFNIDPISGAISVNTDLTQLEDKLAYHLKASVQDGGEPQMTDSADLTIIINHKLAFPSTGAQHFLSEENLTIVLGFALATIFVAIIIIVAIVIIIRRSKNVRHTAEGQPKEKQHMLAPAATEEGHNHTLRTKTSSNNYVSIDELDHRGKSSGVLTNNGRNHYGATIGKDRQLPPVEFQRLTKEHCEMPSDGEEEEEVVSSSTTSRSRSLQKQVRTSSPAAAAAAAASSSNTTSWHSLHEQHDECKSTCPVSRERDAESVSVGSISNSDSGRGHSSEEGEGHRLSNRSTDPDQIKTLVHQLHLKKKQLKDLSSNRPSPKVKVNGTSDRSNKDTPNTQVKSPQGGMTDGKMAARCKASSPVSRSTVSSSCSIPSNLTAHGSYPGPRTPTGSSTLPRRQFPKEEQTDYISPNAYHQGDLSGRYRHGDNGHRSGGNKRRSYSRTSLNCSDFDLAMLASGDYAMYESVDSIV